MVQRREPYFDKRKNIDKLDTLPKIKQQLYDFIDDGLPLHEGFANLAARAFREHVTDEAEQKQLLAELNRYEMNSAQMRRERRRSSRREALSERPVSEGTQRAMLNKMYAELRSKEAVEQALIELRNAQAAPGKIENLKKNKNLVKNADALLAMLHDFNPINLYSENGQEAFGSLPMMNVSSAHTAFTSTGRHTSQLMTRYHRPVGEVGVKKTGKGPMSEEHRGNIGQIHHLFNALNQNSRVLNQSKGSIQIGGERIWSTVEAGSTYNAYHDRSIHGQRQIELFRDFYDNFRSSGFTTFDFETWGNFQDDPFFHVSEMSAHRFTPDGKGGFKEEHFGRIIKPNSKTYKHMKDLVQELRSNPNLIYELDDITQRKLFDLTRYSTLTEGGFTAAKLLDGSKQVIDSAKGKALAHDVEHSNAYKRLFDGKLTNPSEYLLHNVMYSKHIENGLQNIMTHGYEAKAALRDWNAQLKNNSSMFISQNGEFFDTKAIAQWASTLNMQAAQPGKHLDWLLLNQTFASDIQTLHEILGRPEGLPFEEGALTLNEFRKTFLMDIEKSHAGSYDTGKDGLGGIVIKQAEAMMGILEGAKEGASDVTKFFFNDTPIFKGQTFFAPGAVKNREASFTDFQVEVAEGDKKYNLLTTDFNDNVINANTFYTVQGVHEIKNDKGIVTHYGLELYDNARERSVFVNRDAATARYDIAEFMHRNLINWDGNSPEHIKQREQVQERMLIDRARRRYEGLFGLESGWTKGYGAAKRIYENIGKTMDVDNFDDFLAKGDWNSAVSKDEYGNPLKDKKGNFIRTVNEDEAREMWAIRGRLVDEYSTMSTAIDAIEQRYEGKGKVSMLQKALVFQRFGQEIDNKIGDANRVDIDALEHEKRILTYHDNVNGRDRSLNLRSMDTAMSGMISYMYSGMSDATKEDGVLKTRHANEQLINLISSLADSKVLDEEEADSFVRAHYSLGLQNSPITTATHLAHNLINGFTDFREKISVEDMTRRKEIDSITASSLITDVMDSSKGIIGSITQKNKNTAMVQVLNQGKLGDVLRDLDSVDSVTREVTQLNPNNAKALNGLIETVLNDKRYKGMNVSLTMNEEQTVVDMFVYDSEREAAVLSQLNRGQNPTSAIKMSMPLIQKNGTMVIGNQVVNAGSYLVWDQKQQKNVKISSVEKLSFAYQNLLQSFKMEKEGEEIIGPRNVASHLQDGNYKEAQGLINWLFRNETNELSGVKRNFTDSLGVKNNISDLYKQGYTDITSAIIHDYAKDDILRISVDGKSDFQSSAFYTDKNGEEKLKRYVGMDDLTPEGQDLVRQMSPFWIEAEVEAGRLPEMFLSSVKSTHAERGNYSTIDARAMTPYAYLSDVKRDNNVQMQNSYAWNADQQQAILKATGDAGTYLNFDYMTVTPVMKALMEEGTIPDELGNENPMRDYRQTFNTAAMMADDVSIENRLYEMLRTEEGANILIDEGILRGMNADGTADFDPIRKPTIYEQQMIVSSSIMDQLKMSQLKKLNLDEIEIMWHNLEKDKIDAESKKAATFKVVEDTIWAINKRTGEQLKWGSDKISRNLPQEAIIEMSADDRFAIAHYQEDVHKLFLATEKGTPGGGQWNGKMGYSQRFMDAFSGVKGLGIIYGPNIKKHGDFDSILAMKSNVLAEVLNALKTSDPGGYDHLVNEIYGMDMKIDIDVATDENGRDYIVDNARYFDDAKGDWVTLGQEIGMHYNEETKKWEKGKGITREHVELYERDLDKLIAPYVAQLPKSALKDADGNSLSWGIQQTSAAQVGDWSNADGRVRYGVRELDVLRRKGGGEIADAILAAMFNENDPGRRDAIREGRGILDGVKAIAGELDAPSIKVADFVSAPSTVDKTNIRGNYGSILDTDFIESKVGEGYKGFYLDLSDVTGANGNPLSLKVDGRDTNQVFIPYVSAKEGEDGAFHRKQMHKMIADIYESSDRLNRMRNTNKPTKKQAVEAKLQRHVNSLVERIKYDATSSKGHIFENVLKVRMKNSHQGITKIVSPTTSTELMHDKVFINENMARKMGIYDEMMKTLADGKAYYAASTRYPTFHEGAHNVIQLELNNAVPDNQQFITSGLAELEKADSDGDFNHLVALKGKKLQNNAAQVYQNQMERRAELLGVTGEDMDAMMREITRQSAGKAETMNFKISDLFKSIEKPDAKGVATEQWIMNNNSTAEVLAKTSKALVGQASIVNSRLRLFGEEYFKDNFKANEAIKEFGRGLEQKIISSKHGGPNANLQNSAIRTIRGQEYLTHGGLQLIQGMRRAMQTGSKKDWNKVRQIDRDLLGGMFSKDFQMEEAIKALSTLKMDQLAPQLQASNIGLSSGMKGTAAEISAAIDGGVWQGSTNIDVLKMLETGSYSNGVSSPEVGEFVYGEQSREAPVNLTTTYSGGNYHGDLGHYPGERGGTGGPAIRQDLRPTTSYVESGLEKTLSYLGDATAGKRGIIALGAMGAIGGLALGKAVMGDSLLQENMPHNSGNHDNAMQAPAVQNQQTVRLQEGAQGQQGMAVRISGRAPGDMNNDHVGNLAGQAIASSGLQTNINVRSQDDSSTINRDWLQGQFTTLVENGYVGG